MKKILLFLLVLITVRGFTQSNLVPLPASVKPAAGSFTLSGKTTLVLEGSKLERATKLFTATLLKTYGIRLSTAGKGNATNQIVINFGRLDHPIAGAYNLEISPDKIYVEGDNETGIFYALQTLLQLIPAPGSFIKTSVAVSIPCTQINDYPRFAYRGAHLDVCRHFFTVNEVKQYIDQLAALKLNRFHWHLTDDQGWRIEIKKYPLLTSAGGFRNGTIIGRYPGKGNDSLRYGGFYTQDQIREVVSYAADQFITVVPEIEMPGHASAAIAAYPQLSCFPEEDTKILETTSWAGSRKGKQVQQTWGVFPDVFAPTENTFKFLENVLDEVMQLFPSTYIHIGGDECPKDNWKRSGFCQQLIKARKLKDEHGLQSYFIQRIEKYLNGKGRKIIGWDEILEGGLAPNATVMSWRGEEGGIAAAAQEHDVIMTPEAFCYIDHSQSKNEDSVTIGGYLPLEKIYAYEPVPGAVSTENSKYVLGAQVNMWTEYIGNSAKLQYMLNPRLMAIAEVLWSPKTNRNWENFQQRLPGIFDRLDAQDINYSQAYYDLNGAVVPSADNSGISWQLQNNRPGSMQLKVKTTASGTLRDSVLTIGTSAINLPVYNSGELTAALYRSPVTGNEQPKPLSVLKQIFSYNLATGREIQLRDSAVSPYKGNAAFTLVDGIANTMGLVRAGEFLGFKGTDMEAVIDLGKEISVQEIKLQVFEQTGSWIYRPSSVEFFLGNNKVDFGLLESVSTPSGKAQLVYSAAKKSKGRYIKIIAHNFGSIPAGNPGAGKPAWLFAHEIEVL